MPTPHSRIPLPKGLSYRYLRLADGSVLATVVPTSGHRLGNFAQGTGIGIGFTTALAKMATYDIARDVFEKVADSPFGVGVSVGYQRAYVHKARMGDVIAQSRAKNDARAELIRDYGYDFDTVGKMTDMDARKTLASHKYQEPGWDPTIIASMPKVPKIVKAVPVEAQDAEWVDESVAVS